MERHMNEALQPERTSNPGLQSRQTEILELVRRQGFVAIDQLAKAFRVSEQTVRRDIKQLERRGLVARRRSTVWRRRDAARSGPVRAELR